MKTFYIKIEGYCGTVLRVYKVLATSLGDAIKQAERLYMVELDTSEATEEEYKQYQEEVGEDNQDFGYYDEKHAAEWMEKHPHGWYNNEDDYGEDIEERIEEEE